MGKKGPRQIVFVCSAVVEGKLATEVIELNTSEESCQIFEKKYSAKPQSVQGPFYRKRMGFLDSQTDVKFTGKTRKGIYMDWYCTLMVLDNPPDCVWVFFDNKVDDKKVPKPKSVIVKEEEVQYLTPEELIKLKK